MFLKAEVRVRVWLSYEEGKEKVGDWECLRLCFVYPSYMFRSMFGFSWV